jgi:hypothetical protein
MQNSFTGKSTPKTTKIHDKSLAPSSCPSMAPKTPLGVAGAAPGGKPSSWKQNPTGGGRCRVPTPKQAVRQKCVECVQSPYEVENCGGDRMIGQGDEKNVCYFFPYRMGKGRPSVKTIRKFCVECMGGSRHLVTNCTTTHCPVHPFRFGTNPNRAGIGGKRAAELAFCDEN